VSFEAQALDGAKGALGQIVRFCLTYDVGADPGAPRSLIAKFPVADPDVRARYHAWGIYEREVRFYQALAPRIALRTPRCFYSDIQMDTGACILLLEDLAPAQNGDRAAGCLSVQTERIVRDAARFHAAWWENPQLLEFEWVPPYGAVLLQGLQAMYRQCWGTFVEIMGDALPEAMLALVEEVGERLPEIYRRLGSPWTLVHNDFMLDNFFFDLDPDTYSFAVIDWQLITRACGMMDVASFLGGNVSIADRRAHEMGLLRTYHALLVEHGVGDYMFEQCLDDYRLAMFDGFMRMVMAMGSGDLREEQMRTHRDVICPRFCAAVIDLDAGALLPG